MHYPVRDLHGRNPLRPALFLKSAMVEDAAISDVLSTHRRTRGAILSSSSIKTEEPYTIVTSARRTTPSLPAFPVQIVAAQVVDDDHREVFHDEP
jgi:hypothetical protein